MHVRRTTLSFHSVEGARKYKRQQKKKQKENRSRLMKRYIADLKLSKFHSPFYLMDKYTTTSLFIFIAAIGEGFGLINITTRILSYTDARKLVRGVNFKV